MNSMERVLVRSIRGEEIENTDIESVLQHASGELDKHLIGQLEQLHNIGTDCECRSIFSFSQALEIFRKICRKL